MSYLRLAGALKSLTQKASHPNDLIYKIQLSREQQQQLKRGEVGDGKVGAVELAAPPENAGEQQADQASGNEQPSDQVEADGLGHDGKFKESAENAGKGT
ncbi:hypothetical protein VTL71DRAFT_7495 [Oculimacula yallundae]|uniref:Uncharacterized protein n=1 Tax=Oculimacula yallundae TaxID=86028 RepID=A0ABR4BU97_9HELO